MTKRTRLLAASLLSFLSGLSLAACTSSSTLTGDTAGTGATPGSGSAGASVPTGSMSPTGVATGGAGSGAITTSGSGPLVGADGTSPALGATGTLGDTTGMTGSASGATGSASGMTGSASGMTGSASGMTGSASGTTGSADGMTGSASGLIGDTDDTTGSSVGPTGTGGTTGIGRTTVTSGGTTGSSGGTTGIGRTTGTGIGVGRTTGSSGGTTGSSGGTTDEPGGGPADLGGGAGSGSVNTGSGDTNVECTLPDFPDDLSSLPRNEKLPDPFTFFDGTPVTTKAQWECRRREIQAIAAKYIYGPYPFEPDETTGTVNGGNISITCKEGSKTENFTASVSGNGDVMVIDMGSGILPGGGKKLSFGSGFEGKIKNLFGLSGNMNTNVATGWMVDRVIEVLEQNPGGGLDPTKIAVSGCSGCGKGAFLVGVFSRIPMTVIVESGGGGAASFRQAEWFRHGAGKSTWQCADAAPQSIDNLEENGICGPWVTSAASQLRSKPDLVYNLPIDQHLLLATIAPRYLVHFSNNNGTNSWCHLGGTCEALSAWAANPVWHALGVPDNMAFEMYNGGHCGVGDTGIAAAMFKRAFQGDTSAKTGVVKIPDNGVQQPVSEWKDMWIDWDMETVLK